MTLLITGQCLLVKFYEKEIKTLKHQLTPSIKKYNYIKLALLKYMYT